MKHLLRLSLIFVFILLVRDSKSQITKLSNNTNLETGIPLGSIAVLISENDSLWRTDGTAVGTFAYAPTGC